MSIHELKQLISQGEGQKLEFNPENSTEYSIQWAAKC